MKSCACGKPISLRATSCKSCAQRARWEMAGDPRREQLRTRNAAARDGNCPYADREWLRGRYEDGTMSLRDIAAEAGCGLRTIARWMEAHDIPTRDKHTPRKRGPASKNWKGACICPQCGGRMSSSRRSCLRCRLATMHGSGNPNWRGGVTPENQRGRQGVSAKAWRTAVFERDRYTCQDCGDARGGNLQAHHIREWAVHPDMRFDVTNGITLCVACHTAAHS